MRRSTTSVPFNIAEGNVKRSSGDKIRYFDIAAASLEELHCEIMLSKDLKYIPLECFQSIDKQIHRVSYLLMKLRNAFK